MSKHPKLDILGYVYSRPTHSQAVCEAVTDYLLEKSEEEGEDKACKTVEGALAVTIKEFKDKMKIERKRVEN